jgi:hypothetical protein
MDVAGRCLCSTCPVPRFGRRLRDTLRSLPPYQMKGISVPDQVLRVQSVLTARDHQLLNWLYDHGVLTTGQIAEALFPSLDFAQHRLHRLTALKVVDRFRPFRADGGSHPFHYVIDQLGAEVVAAQRDEPIPRPGYAKAIRRRWTASRILRHRLGVNGFFTQLAGQAGHGLQRWWPESRCSAAGAFAGPGDRVELITQTLIRPDGHGVWSGVPFFLEYDTGGEHHTNPASAPRERIGWSQRRSRPSVFYEIAAFRRKASERLPPRRFRRSSQRHPRRQISRSAP